jgi:hypothetical protein
MVRRIRGKVTMMEVAYSRPLHEESIEMALYHVMEWGKGLVDGGIHIIAEEDQMHEDVMIAFTDDRKHMMINAPNMKECLKAKRSAESQLSYEDAY